MKGKPNFYFARFIWFSCKGTAPFRNKSVYFGFFSKNQISLSPFPCLTIPYGTHWFSSNTKVKPCWTGFVVGWVTVWEYPLKASIFVLFVLPFVFYSPHCTLLNYCCDWFPSKNNYRGHTVLFKIVFEIRSQCKCKKYIRHSVARKGNIFFLRFGGVQCS